jgi:hypothetical protein
LDIPYMPAYTATTSVDTPPEDESMEGEEEIPDPPHTMKTVKRYPLAKPASNVAQVRLSAFEKNKYLRDRERRWETLDYACKRVIKVEGEAGVYELQEGIFLMSDEYSSADDAKVSGQNIRDTVLIRIIA